MKRLLVTDLDNTLYDWVAFFAPAFSAMVDSLVALLGVDREALLDEFREVSASVGSLEHPYAAFELPSVRATFPDATPEQLKYALDPAFHAFNKVRKERLKLYDGVEETLSTLTQRGVSVIGYTESTRENAWFRIQRLRVDRYIRRLYVLEGHPIVELPRELATPPPPAGYVQTVPSAERKPNPALLRDIGEREGASPGLMVYVGDSLGKDVAMAKAAGVLGAWAKYGATPDAAAWQVLVRVTQWSAGEVKAAESLEHPVQPDAVLDSYQDLLPLFGIESAER